MANSLFNPSATLDKNHLNTSTATLNGNLYFCARSILLRKYDGQNMYMAGLPQPDQPTTSTQAGSLTGDYKYIFTYKQVDNQGNIIESVASEVSATVTASSHDILVTLPNLFNVFPGVYTNSRRAYVNGAQVTVTTIDVDFDDLYLSGAGALDSQEKLTVGDTAYFFDSVSADYVARKITAVTATTITIEGDAVTVADGAPISNNLRTAIYRTVDAGNNFFLVAELPWNACFDGTNYPDLNAAEYIDSTADGSLGAQYLYPLDGQTHELSSLNDLVSTIPTELYSRSYSLLTTYRNRLVLSGASEDPNKVEFSVTNGPEYFPPTNSFLVGQEEPGVITGIVGTDRFLLVFKKTATYRVTGSFVGNDITVEKLSGVVGCVAHHTIKTISYNGRFRIIWLGKDGVYESVEGSAPIEISQLIRPEFSNAKLNDGFEFALSRSVAMIDTQARQYWLFIPEEDITVNTAARVIPTVEPDEKTQCLVYDFGLIESGEQPQWYKWTTIDMTAGAFEFRGIPTWVRRVAQNEITIYHKIQREDSYTSFDHDGPIFCECEFGSIAAPSADILTKFLRTRISSFDPIIFDDFTLKVQTYLDYIQSSSNTTDTRRNSSLTFTLGPTSGKKRDVQHLNPAKAYALRYRLEHFRAGERAIITAISTEVNAPFTEKMKSERDNYS